MEFHGNIRIAVDFGVNKGLTELAAYKIIVKARLIKDGQLYNLRRAKALIFSAATRGTGNSNTQSTKGYQHMPKNKPGSSSLHLT